VYSFLQKNNKVVVYIPAILDMQKLGVRYVGPCHCSGDKSRELFEQAYKEHFISIGVGNVNSKKLL